jgi:hypothetical protein
MLKCAQQIGDRASPVLSHEKYDRFMHGNYDSVSNFFIRWIMCADLMKRIGAIAESRTAGKHKKAKEGGRVACKPTRRGTTPRYLAGQA